MTILVVALTALGCLAAGAIAAVAVQRLSSGAHRWHCPECTATGTAANPAHGDVNLRIHQLAYHSSAKETL